ncbi:MAG: TRAP transporter substrate-binding protein DctP [Sneathiellales bacterium]|nr:TRAP transporter substrate-binding protein DctP [Sneathiellales bacterium]
MKNTLFGIGVIAVFLNAVTANSLAETRLKMGLAAPAKTPWAAAARAMAEKVERSTKGSVKIIVFPGSQLGNEQDVIRQVSRGRIHIGSFSNTAASLMVPEIALLAAPYLWESRAQADCALDNHMISAFDKMFKKKGLVILGWSEVGFMGYASKQPIRDFDAIKGLKIRVAPTKASDITTKAFGANAVVLPITEVASALQTGLVEAADLPGLAFTALGIGKVAGNWLATNHSHQVGIVLMSKKVWNRLSIKEQQKLKEAREGVVKLRKQVRGAEKETLAKFAQNGGNVISPSRDDLRKWRSRAEGARQKLVEEIGGDAASIYRKILAAKNACNI